MGRHRGDGQPHLRGGPLTSGSRRAAGSSSPPRTGRRRGGRPLGVRLRTRRTGRRPGPPAASARHGRAWRAQPARRGRARSCSTGCSLEGDVTVLPGNLGSPARSPTRTVAPGTAALRVDADDADGKRNSDLDRDPRAGDLRAGHAGPGPGTRRDDSIVDGGIGELASIRAGRGRGRPGDRRAGRRLDACTVLGRTSARTLHASNCLFTEHRGGGAAPDRLRALLVPAARVGRPEARSSCEPRERRPPSASRRRSRP